MKGREDTGTEKNLEMKMKEESVLTRRINRALCLNLVKPLDDLMLSA